MRAILDFYRVESVIFLEIVLARPTRKRKRQTRTKTKTRDQLIKTSGMLLVYTASSSTTSDRLAELKS